GSAGLSALAADSRLTALLSARERARLPELGVERFAAYLKARADRADDLVDYGFLKVQTDIYRVRQLVLGTTDATRLAVSPALANIARADTAVATQENISTLFERLRSSPAPESGAVVASAPAGSGGTTTRPSGAGGAVGSVANVGAFRAEAFRVTRPSNVPLASTVIAEAVREQPAASRIGAAEMVRAESSIRPLAAARTYSPVEVKQAEPLIGNFEIRTISIAERIQAPKAQEARDYSTSPRQEAVLGLVRLADDLTGADGAVPGLFEGIDVWGVEGDEFVPGGNDPVAAVRRPLADFLNPTSRPTLMAALLRPP